MTSGLSGPTKTFSLTRRRLFGATAGSAAVIAAAPVLANSFRAAPFGAEAIAPGLTAIEVVSDEIIALVQKRRAVNTAIDKSRATAAVINKKGSNAVAQDPFGLNTALGQSQAAQASVGLKPQNPVTLDEAMRSGLAARDAIDDLLRSKMSTLKSMNAETNALASLQRHTLEGARTEMRVAV